MEDTPYANICWTVHGNLVIAPMSSGLYSENHGNLSTCWKQKVTEIKFHLEKTILGNSVEGWSEWRRNRTVGYGRSPGQRDKGRSSREGGRLREVKNLVHELAGHRREKEVSRVTSRLLLLSLPYPGTICIRPTHTGPWDPSSPLLSGPNRPWASPSFLRLPYFMSLNHVTWLILTAS